MTYDTAKLLDQQAKCLSKDLLLYILDLTEQRKLWPMQAVVATIDVACAATGSLPQESRTLAILYLEQEVEKLKCAHK